MKKSILALTLAGVLTVGGSMLAFADEVAEVTGCRNNGAAGVESLMSEGLSFEEAKAQKLEEKFERVDSAVERGTITGEEATTIKAEMESNSAECVAPGENKGTHEGYRLNEGLGGNGEGCENGNGGRKGAGMGLRNGSCAGNQQ